MHCLEHILLVTSVAVEKDKISKAELVRVLAWLAQTSGEYIPESTHVGPDALREEPEDIVRMNAEWHRRFGHLMTGSE
jgi:hypothetical protein